MNPSMPSPVSPYEQHAKQQYPAQRQCYPTSPHSEAMGASNGPNHGLGLYPCSMPPTQTSVSELAPSSQPAESWPQNNMMHHHPHHEYSQTSQPPDIFSAAFDPFSGYSVTASTHAVHGISSPEAPGLEFCATPPGSNIQSHRSSVSSTYEASESYSQSGSEYAYTPKVKVEEAGGEWYPAAGNEHILQRSISTQGPLVYSPNPATLPSQTEDLYRQQPPEWSQSEPAGYVSELHANPDTRRPRFDVQPILPSVTRMKKKRQRTTPEEATHECRVCGKLFKRSYNWKSHMETHNPERKYPHPCTAMIGTTPCSKKFQRKTDLDRHYDSVCRAKEFYMERLLTACSGAFEGEKS